MENKKLLFLAMAVFVLLFSNHPVFAEQKILYYEKPLELEEMGTYEAITFEEKNLEKVEKGMTQESVLKLLGIPSQIEKQKRKSNRWTFSFFYPEGYRINFRNGLVVGKEKTE